MLPPLKELAEKISNTSESIIDPSKITIPELNSQKANGRNPARVFIAKEGSAKFNFAKKRKQVFSIISQGSALKNPFSALDAKYNEIFSKLSTQIEDKEQTIADLEKSIISLESDISSKNSQISSMQSGGEELKAQVEEVSRALGEANATISKLNNKLDAEGQSRMRLM